MSQLDYQKVDQEEAQWDEETYHKMNHDFTLPSATAAITLFDAIDCDEEA
jgi:hypothetical protein